MTCKILTILAMLCLTTVISVSALLFTNPGLRIGLSFVPGLDYQSAEGSLWNHIALKGVSYKSNDVHISGDSLQVDWAPLELLSKSKLKINSLRSESLLITLLNSPNESSTEDGELSIPIDIVVGEVSLQKNRISTSPETALPEFSITANRIQVSENLITLVELLISSNDESLKANGEVSLDFSNKGRIALSLEAKLKQILRLEEASSIHANLNGDWSSIRLAAETGGIFDANIAGELTLPLTSDRSWQVEVRVTQTKLTQLQDTKVSGLISSTGNIDNNQISATLELAKGEQTTPLSLTAEMENDLLRVDQLDLGDNGALLSTKGTVENMNTLNLVKLDAELFDLAAVGRLFDTALPDGTSQLKIEGNVDSFQLAANSQIETQDVGKLNINIEGNASQRRFTTNRFEAYSEQLRLDGLLILDYVDSTQPSISIERLQGNVRSLPILLSGKVEKQDTSFIVRSLTGTMAETSLSIDGSVGETINLTWQVDARDLSIINQSWAGTLSTSGKVSGSLTSPSLRAGFNAKDLKLNDVSLRNAQGDMNINWSNLSDWSGHVFADEFKFGQNLNVSKAELVLSGNLANHTATTTLLIGNETIILNWDGAHTADAYNYSFHSNGINIESFDNYLTETRPFGLEGLATVKGQGSFSNQSEPMTMAVHLKSDQLVLVPKDRQRENLLIEDFSSKLISKQNSTSINTQATLPLNGKLDLTGKIDSWLLHSDLLDANAALELELDFPDVSPLSTALPNGAMLTGKLNSKAQLSGSLQKPILKSDTQFIDASLTIEELGIAFTDLAFQLNSLDSNQFNLSASANAGEGSLSLLGTANLAKALEYDLTLTAENALLINNPEVRAIVSANLVAKSNLETLLFSGQVTVDEASVASNYTPGVARESIDLIIEDEFIERKQQKMLMDVLVDLGENTRIQANGLSGRLVGKPRIKRNAKGLVTSTGDIRLVNGKLSILGEELVISIGSATYTGGAISNPYLDVEVTKTIGDAKVGLKLLGNLDSPEVTLVSTPFYPDPDILSLLFFEKPLDALGAGDAIKLVSIAKAINEGGSPQGQSRLDKIQESVAAYLGLDSLDVSLVSGGEDKQLAITSKINSKVNIGYTYNLVTSLQALFLRYKLNENWWIQSSVDSETGADLIYTR